MALVASLSKDKAGSASVDTRPGTTFKSSLPNSTSCPWMLRQSTRRLSGKNAATHQTVEAVLDLRVDVAILRNPRLRKLPCIVLIRRAWKPYPPFCLA